MNLLAPADVAAVLSSHRARLFTRDGPLHAPTRYYLVPHRAGGPLIVGVSIRRTWCALSVDRPSGSPRSSRQLAHLATVGQAVTRAARQAGDSATVTMPAGPVSARAEPVHRAELAGVLAAWLGAELAELRQRQRKGTTVDTFTGLILWAAIAAAYLAPSIVALVRKPPNVAAIIALNVLGGWTVLGWLAAIALAFRDRPQPAPWQMYGPQQYYPPRPQPPYQPWPAPLPQRPQPPAPAARAPQPPDVSTPDSAL